MHGMKHYVECKNNGVACPVRMLRITMTGKWESTDIQMAQIYLENSR